MGSLAAGASAEIRITVSVTRGGGLPVTASVDAREGDPVPANDRAAAEVAAIGSSCTVVGTTAAESLRSRRRDVVCGLGGDDVLLSGPRPDRLLAGSGNDALVAEGGRDRLDGGDGIDACTELERRSAARCERSVFALAEDLALAEMTPTTVGYGYHQSLFRTAIGMRAFGAHVVMGSRGRGTGATTAADVVVGSRARVRAPVSGDVVSVRRYLLYCASLDWKIVIRPAQDPTLRVLVLHLARPSVREGDAVTAGISVLGRARTNDGPSAQANRYFPDRYPHVHVEVERNRASPTPGCALRPRAAA